MAFYPIQGGLWIPDGIRSGTNAVAFSSLLMDAAAEKVAHIFPVPKTGTLDTFEFLLGTVTQAPVNGLRCSFQDVSLTTGDPDAAVDQFRTVTAGLTSNTWVSPGLITSDGTDSGTKRSVTRGDLMCAVIEYASFSASDSLNINVLNINGGCGLMFRSYVDHFTAAWAKNASVGGNIALKYNDGSYGYVPTYTAASAINTHTYDSATATSERALYFKFPIRVKVGGAWLRVGGVSTGSDFQVILYDSDGTTSLATVSVDGNAHAAMTVDRTCFVQFPTEVTLLGDTFYRLSIKPTTANDIRVYDLQVSTAGIMDAHEGGQSFYASEKVSGTWQETTTRRPFMGLLVTSLFLLIAPSANPIQGTHWDAVRGEGWSTVQQGGI